MTHTMTISCTFSQAPLSQINKLMSKVVMGARTEVTQGLSKAEFLIPRLTYI